jgi:ABC-type transport system substrate-binding protein
MSDSKSMKTPLMRRFLPVFSLLIGLALLDLGIARSPAAQEADDSKAKKDETGQPAKPKPIREEEETTKPKIKKPLRVDDDRRKPGRAGLDSPSHLADLAKDTKYPAVQELFKSLAKVRDVVTKKVGGALVVDPVASYIGNAPEVEKTLQVQPYDESDKRLPKQKLELKDVRSISHYEDRTLTTVEGFLSKKEMPRLDMLRAAEVALDTVLRYHTRAREKEERQGDAWKNVEKNLKTKLLSVQQDLLAEYANVNNWDDGFEAAKRLAASSNDPDQRAKASQQLAQIVAQSLKEKQYSQARRRKKALAELFPDSPAVIPIDKELQEKARALMDEAKTKKDPMEAMRLVREAEEIWPRLPGLRDLGLKLSNSYPILRVGVPELPEDLKNLKLSPATAFSDTEKRAVELIFESLVKPGEDPAFGQRYYPGLAVGRAKIIPRGRQFQLPRDAHWSDGTDLTATDVIRTVQLLQDRNFIGFAPEWAGLLENPTPGSDPYVVNLTLRQGFLDPLDLMTFKVLPTSQLDKADNPRFAKNPVGSGPFMFDKLEGGEARFLANSQYRRVDKPGLPHIREIQLFHSADPAGDFSAGRLHLLLDLPTERIQKLKGLKGVTVQTLPNRRIYFLAVNHQFSRQLQNEHLRRAIAYAVNRKKILDEVFRADLKNDPQPPHRPLNGPYPLGSWACLPLSTLPADLFDLRKARAQATEVKKDFTRVKLSLKYPEGDPRVERACEAIRYQVAALDAGIQLDLEPRPARQLRDEVELNHAYDLAYYHYDYPSELYWAWPLFDPSERAMDRGGPNFLGYKNTGLASLFIRAMSYRQFEEVQKLIQETHAQLEATMPLIPLWQLDTHIAIHEDLTPVRLDPLLVFSAAEEWRLEKK